MLKKKVIWIVGILCLVAVAVIALLPRGEQQPKQDMVAKNLVSDFLTAYQAKDPKCGKYLLTIDNSDISFDGFQGILAERVSFKITGYKTVESQQVVTVEVTNVDLPKAFEKVAAQFSEGVTSEEVLQAVKEELCSPRCATRVFVCQVPVSQLDGGRIVLSSDLSNALLGGYNEYLAELTMGQEG